jgi:hypothetical protein
MHKSSLFALVPCFAIGCAHDGEKLFDKSGRTGAALTGEVGGAAQVQSLSFAVQSVACAGASATADFHAAVDAQAASGRAFVSLEPGCFAITATPLDASGQLAADCAAASALVEVAAGVVADVHLFPTCQIEGGIDAGANSAPDIESVVQLPDVELGCESLTLCVSAVDVDGDALSLDWSTTSSLLGGIAVASSTLTTDVAGASHLEECVTLGSDLLGQLDVGATVSDGTATAQLSASVDLETCGDLGVDL